MVKSKHDTNVCVIGAGVCGIVAVKVCLEAGFKVDCYDKSPHLGGLWKYHDEKRNPENGFIPSVMRTTILNTTKELSSFSDYPPPELLPNYMKHNLYMNYINDYVDNFKLKEHIHLRKQILNCELKLRESQESNCNQEGHNNTTTTTTTSTNVEWLIEIKNLQTNQIELKRFDKLMIATGHHNVPHEPKFKNQHLFKGEIIHSVIVKDAINDERFIDKKVVVVGFGNSACDLANDICQVSDKCYLSSHRGNWIWSRLTPKGVGEFEYKSRYDHYRAKYLPKSIIEKVLSNRIKSRLNHDLLGLTPKHTPLEHIPVINDTFPFRVFTGGITIKSSIKEFTENGLIFDERVDENDDFVDEQEEIKIDVVIFATGYTVKLPFLDEYKYGLKSDEHPDDYEIFLNVFAPRLKIPEMISAPGESISLKAVKSLAFIGFAQSAGSMTVVAELQSRWATLVFGNKCQLPSVEKMLDYIDLIRKKRKTFIRSHQKDQLVGDYIGYLDEIAKFIGCKPNLTKLFIKDFFLWKQLMFGPSLPYQYRLMGPGEWERARETIMTVNHRVLMGINDGRNKILYKNRKRCLSDQLSKRS